jgi:hypothetical protein
VPEPLAARSPAVEAEEAMQAEPSAAPPSTPSGRTPALAAKHQSALDLFRGSGAPAAVSSAPPGGADDVLLLSDEEEPPSRLRWAGLALLVIVLFGCLFLLFVMARNDWKVDFKNFGGQVRRAFGMTRASEDLLSCLDTRMLGPEVIAASDGAVVVVRGTVANTCPHTVPGVLVRCRLEGPGGPWPDDARPFRVAGGSGISEDGLSGQRTVQIMSEISDAENPAGVVMPGSTHEVWCVFLEAAAPDAPSSRFRRSFEVVVP